MNNAQGSKAYQQINIASEVENASPHRLVSMLFEGAIRQLAIAKGAIERQDTASKGTAISKTIAIIGELEGSLQDKETNEVSGNLSRLYDYMIRTLSQANIDSSTEKLNEVGLLIIEIKSGWDAIPEDQRNPPRPAEAQAGSAAEGS
ncbi:flagellar export chaperone FliS [Marinobacterium marinum]|uniref:Flagellar secretion chaperone FliS n=1 Tax=Marinobacterium marinum TaxID=2756129 RepID=A0A7W1WVE3_9GAMM|nr:flagellar export chaperone FliS [Marinobacterium marinum]MBA4500914.1 flagellar export chaperone FliS [Marinobacterium marinum]